MATFCIPKKQAETLKRAFKSGELSIEKLYNLGSSSARIEKLSKYIGNASEFTNASLEKAFISPAQKTSLKNWIYKNIGQAKPLYKELTINDAKKLAGLKVSELKKLSPEDRIKKFSEFISGDNATKLEARFIKSKNSGNLANWEQRAMGTKKVLENNRLKGDLARLEALDDLGVLSPKESEQFMESFVESKLGVSVTLDQSKKISSLTKEQSQAFEKVDGDWTFTNKDNLLDYFEKRTELEKYIKSLGENDVLETMADIARANILASPRILKNSLLYQALPATERAITKRLVSGNFSDDVLKSNIFEKIQAKLSGIIPNSESRIFINKQTAMALEIYDKTGYDISRMNTLAEGNRIFGEKFGGTYGKSIKESKGILGKTGAVLRGYSRKMNVAPKWMAGGTDTLFANIGRADTSTMLSKEIASMEKMKGLLPKGMTKEQRATQLLKESYSFNPADEKALRIRDIAIQDAHKMNGTQYSEMADKLLKLRNGLNLGKFKLGKVAIPFLKIPATVKAEGIKVATGKGIYNGIRDISRASKLQGAERATAMYKGVNDLVRYLGFTGAAVFITTMLDTDDYKGSWDSMSYKDYELSRAEGAGTDMIRIGDKWIPLRYFAIIDIPIAAIMSARQAKERGGSATAGAVSGVAGQILSIPGIAEVKDILSKNIAKLAKSKDLTKSLEAMGLSSDILDWAKVRVAPSVLSYDAYNIAIGKESKYDYLGREIKGANFLGAKQDVSNEITKEFNRLNNTGNPPVIATPNKGTQDEIIKLQRELAERYSKIIDSNNYKKMDNEEKKDRLDKERRNYLLNKIR